MNILQRKQAATAPIFDGALSTLTFLGFNLDQTELRTHQPITRPQHGFLYLVPEYAVRQPGNKVEVTIPHEALCFTPDAHCLIVLTGQIYGYDQGGDIPAPLDTRVYHGYSDYRRFQKDTKDLKEGLWPKEDSYAYQSRMDRPLHGIKLWIGSAVPLAWTDVEAYNLIYRVPNIHLHLVYK